jgi:glycosyltransferase involved in cell wall biosynthesis
LSLLFELNEENPFDVIWGEHDAAYYYVRYARKKLGVPVVTVLQQSFMGGLRSQLAELRYNKNLALLLLRQFPGVIYRYLTKELVYAGRADAVIAPSKQSAKDARWEYMLSRKRIFASVNGVDVDQFRPLKNAGGSIRDEIGVDQDSPIVFTASRLVRGKGLHLLIRGFAELLNEFPAAKLLIAGVGPARHQLVDLTDRIGLSDKVLFLGYIRHETLPEYYNACDIFVYPTLLYESFGISVAEAMACARPVVAARSGGISTSIEHGDNGFLYAPTRVDELVKWCALLLREPVLAERIGISARKKAEDALSSTRMLREAITVFRSVVEQNR